MKKLLITSFLVLTSFNLGFASSNVASYYTQKKTLVYPLSFLRVEDKQEKAFALLKDIETYELAKIYIAYCYFSGKGVACDKAKAEEILEGIEKNSFLANTLNDFLNNNFKDIAFARIIADLIYTRTQDFKLAYDRFISYIDKKTYAKEYEELIALAGKSSLENANLLVKNAIDKKDFKYALELVKNLKKTSFEAFQLFAEIIYNNEESLVKEIIKALEENGFEKDRYAFELAYCYEYGFGVEADKQKTDGLLKLSAKSKWNSPLADKIRPYSSIKSLVGDENIEKLMYKLALLQLEDGKDTLYLKCLEYGYGVEKDLNKVTEVMYEKYKKDDKAWLDTSLLRNLKHLKKCDMLMDVYETILSRPRKEYTRTAGGAIIKDRGVYNSSNSEYIFEYAYYLMNGIGCEKNPEKALNLLNAYYANIETISDESNLFSSYLMPLEYLAYCHDNGIGTEKDEAKAESIRADIHKYANKKTEGTCYFKIWELYTMDIRSTKPTKFYIKIPDEKMEKYYEPYMQADIKMLKDNPQRGVIISL